MSVRMGVCGWTWGVVLLMGAGILAQQPEDRAPAATVGAALREMASRAAVVFVGQVTRVQRKQGIVEVTFAVEQPVRGAPVGSYVMREWAGRWVGGQEDFQVGQRAMFFLHAPNATGLSSAVDGRMGAVPVVLEGVSGEALLDLRWVIAHVRRSVGNPAVGAGRAAVGMLDGIAAVKHWQGEEAAEPKLTALPGEGVVVGQSESREIWKLEPSADEVTRKEVTDVQR